MAPLSITTIQTDLSWEDKASNLNMLEKKIFSVAASTELIVLPEMFSTGFSMKPEQFAETMDGPTVCWMKRLASTHKIILTGSLMIEEGGKYYNRLLWILPNGQSGQYDKRHLFAYGHEDRHYSPGNRRLIASVNGWKVNLQVCYDLRFPVWSRQQLDPQAAQSQPEYDLLIYVANWPERRSLAWKTLLQARAIENQCYVAGVNRVGLDGHQISHSGDSMLVDPAGEILYQKSGEEDLFTYRLQKERLQEVRSRFPFWKDADQFHIEP